MKPFPKAISHGERERHGACLREPIVSKCTKACSKSLGYSKSKASDPSFGSASGEWKSSLDLGCKCRCM